MNPPAPKVVDGTTYTLLKQPADFPVTSFSADPATLSDLDQPVTLYWSVSDQGKQLTYGLRIVSVGLAAQPGQGAVGGGVAGTKNDLAVTFKDCVSDGNCYSWQDGQQGVPTPLVNQTTTFALDIVKADPVRGRTVVGTLQTTLRVIVPEISQLSYLRQSPSGGMVWLHWLAFNSRTCSVQLDGAVVVANAPTDTYRSGYLVTLPARRNPRQLSVIGHALSGNAQASFLFPSVTARQPARIKVANGPVSVAFTPDGLLALVGSETDGPVGTVTVIDVPTQTVEAKGIPVGDAAEQIAITPDGKLAVVLTDSSIVYIDIASRTRESFTIGVGHPMGVAVTPDGRLALVTQQMYDRVMVIDIANRVPGMAIVVPKGPAAIAVTPDGLLAFVTCIQDDIASYTVAALDIAGRKVKGDPITVGRDPYCVAVTPDGSLALVTSTDGLTFIDVETLQVVATVPTGDYPEWVSVTPGGTQALVTSLAGGNVTVVDIATRTGVTVPGDISNCGGYVLSPDGSLALASGSDGPDDHVGYVAVL
jgi:YVTN family beta-propeller protein